MLFWSRFPLQEKINNINVYNYSSSYKRITLGVKFKKIFFYIVFKLKKDKSQPFVDIFNNIDKIVITLVWFRLSFFWGLKLLIILDNF